jgi:hypothetical protein
MTPKIKHLISYALVVSSAAVFSSCFQSEDPGPVQEVEKEYTLTDFDRLEISDAFNIDVEQGNYFEISVRGDRRNVDDLVVKTEGNTLVIRYKDNRNRRHDTYINITMPSIVAANFSGASDSMISGFHDLRSFDFYLSGASVCQLDLNATQLDIVLSGASYLNIRGTGEKLHAELSGASVLKAFHFPVTDSEMRVSGASDGHVTVSNSLKAIASGASVILYRGNPTVTSEVSGSSSVHQD